MCVPHSDGTPAALSSTVVCALANPLDGTCPREDMYRCECPLCSYGTFGPCHGPEGRCVGFDTSNPGNSTTSLNRCPTGYYECGSAAPPRVAPRVCPVCRASTRGPCQQVQARTCSDYVEGG